MLPLKLSISWCENKSGETAVFEKTLTFMVGDLDKY